MYTLCPSTPPKIYHGHIPKGYAGTLATVQYISDLIKQGAKDFCVRQMAIGILRQYRVSPKDYLGEICALFDWVKNNIRYTKDTYRVELLHSARRMLELRAGDCDDMTILLAAMLESVGHPVRLVIVGRNLRRKNQFSHIYLETLYRDRWIALDPTMNKPAGWAPKAPNKKIIALP
ncbi:MAG: transglutaminase family protein [candidate division KSB1 bacterium]|nr:transglutaminase family protein [candidate division KSB1 bacterium]MDZ7366266.1 transglutaminase family protein [candidate division KSB1 bacterium]MDZ7404484.1 transglutaminase family protein [candidate division KSB1 bacterium]